MSGKESPLANAARFIAGHSYVVLYLSRPDCGVCSALRPRIEEIVASLPESRFYAIDLDETPAAAAEYSVFTIPAIIVYVDGRETLREARYLSVQELQSRMMRLYALRFNR